MILVQDRPLNDSYTKTVTTFCSCCGDNFDGDFQTHLIDNKTSIINCEGCKEALVKLCARSIDHCWYDDLKELCAKSVFEYESAFLEEYEEIEGDEYRVGNFEMLFEGFEEFFELGPQLHFFIVELQRKEEFEKKTGLDFGGWHCPERKTLIEEIIKYVKVINSSISFECSIDSKQSYTINPTQTCVSFVGEDGRIYMTVEGSTFKIEVNRENVKELLDNIIRW